MAESAGWEAVLQQTDDSWASDGENYSVKTGATRVGLPSSLQIWTTDAPESSVVPERPRNLQVWTTDGKEASVVHICDLKSGA
jgi:hypothetical protein